MGSGDQAFPGTDDRINDAAGLLRGLGKQSYKFQ